MGLFRRILTWRRGDPGVVLALGGGGARGLAHLGVLSVLEESMIPVRGIAGTSAGAVTGALWLLHPSAQAACRRFTELLRSGLIPPLPDFRFSTDHSTRENLMRLVRALGTRSVRSLALGQQALVTQEEFDRALAFLVGDATFASLRSPLSVVVCDFETGSPLTLRRGPLRLALAAACAIPAALPPYQVEGRIVVDGGVVADVPAEEATALARGPVVAVDISDLPGKEDLQRITAPRALLRAGLLTQKALRERTTAAAQLVLRPAVQEIGVFDFDRMEEAVAAGRAATLEALPDLRRIATEAHARPRGA